MTRTIRLLVGFFMPVLSGFGTFINLSNEAYTPYGGTALDAGMISTLPIALGANKSEPSDKFGPGPETLYLASMGLVDLPFSVVADTLTLPVTASVSIYRAAKSPSSLEHSSAESASSGP